MPLTPEKIQELEVKHGELAILRAVDRSWEVVFRRPTRTEHRMFRAACHNQAKIADAQDSLSQQCVVYPSQAEYLELLEKYPGIPDSEAFAQAMKQLTGMASEEAGKGLGSFKPSNVVP